MTLPLRRKHQITALNTHRATPPRPALRRLLRHWLAATLALGSVIPASGSAQEWQPTRLPSNANLQPLAQSGPANTSPDLKAGASNTSQHLGSGVVLRWRSTAPRSSDAPTNNGFTQPAPQQGNAGGGSTGLRAASKPNTVASQHFASASSQNPLRRVVTASTESANTSAVHPAAYQQEPDIFADPFGDNVQPPALPGNSGAEDIFNGLPQLPNQVDPPAYGSQFADPLDQPEAPPLPGSDPVPNAPERPAFPPQMDTEDTSPLDLSKSPEAVEPEPIAPPKPLEEFKSSDEDELDAIQRRIRSSSVSCASQRERLKGLPLDEISLDVSPKFGEGLRSVKTDTEKQRMDFANNSMRREWTDYKGNLLATGRLIDLRFDRVVLDVDGSERTFLIRDLSDVDVSYVADVWNLPIRCGTGYDPFEGREFIASTVQWKASGLCHKPLYFEQVQLERYGHEAGPLVQPLVSTATFFATIPILPYKMGIHPPYECQYPLGYFRPGNCAPYMIQPFPWSLRGGLAQAGFVTGAAALIP